MKGREDTVVWPEMKVTIGRPPQNSQELPQNPGPTASKHPVSAPSTASAPGQTHLNHRPRSQNEPRRHRGTERQSRRQADLNAMGAKNTETARRNTTKSAYDEKSVQTGRNLTDTIWRFSVPRWLCGSNLQSNLDVSALASTFRHLGFCLAAMQYRKI